MPSTMHAQALMQLVDESLDVNTTEWVRLLHQHCNHEWGAQYELRSNARHYYSNVHATVLLNLYQAGLLEPALLPEMRSALVRLRDQTPMANPQPKRTEDQAAWDASEGPNVFSTALSCLALLATGDGHLESVDGAMAWLVGQQRSDGLWSYAPESPGNYVISMYAVMALQAALKKRPEACNGPGAADALSAASKAIIGAALSRDGDACWPAYGSGEPCVSNTFAALYSLKLLGSDHFDAYRLPALSFVEKRLQLDQAWQCCIMSEVVTDRLVKTMYTYVPAWLPALLRMGVQPTDWVAERMVNQLLDDVRTAWRPRSGVYPWRSSDSVVQSFICSLALYSIYTWFRFKCRQEIGRLELGMSPAKDVFICHAGDDKADYVRPLRDALEAAGISVWYDEGELLVGDRISSVIGDALDRSRFAVICLSGSFLKKGWPESELGTLFERQQVEGRKVILPVVLDSREAVMQAYPMLRQYYHITWTAGSPGDVAEQVTKVLDRDQYRHPD